MGIAQEQDKFIVRLPDGMRDEIRESAAKNNRSMNAEIIARLGTAATLRDEFAGLALVGIMANNDTSSNPPAYARLAYQQADAMLAARPA